MDERDDETLVVAYRNGDEEALAVLVRRYLQPLYAYTYRLSGNAEAAQDIVQDSFLKAMRKLSTYDETKRFHAWLWRIAHNTAIDWLRTKRAIPFSSFDTAESQPAFAETLADDSALPNEIAVRAENAETLQKALARLPELDCDILSLHHESGLSFADISVVLERPVNTVKSRYRRALLALRKELDQLHP